VDPQTFPALVDHAFRPCSACDSIACYSVRLTLDKNLASLDKLCIQLVKSWERKYTEDADDLEVLHFHHEKDLSGASPVV
jgi:hypothetical protein